MKIKRKDLLQWVNEKTPVRYHGIIYRAAFNGIRYFLYADGHQPLDFYHKGGGIFGLEVNR